MLNKLFAVAFLLLVSACGSMYSTSYQYVPPRDEAGKYCVNNCLSQKSTCERQCTSNKTTCQVMEDAKGYLDYVVNSDPSRSNTSAPLSSYRRNCDLDYTNCKSGCDAEHRMCYTNCGGEVLESRTCQAFCG